MFDRIFIDFKSLRFFFMVLFYKIFFLNSLFFNLIPDKFILILNPLGYIFLIKVIETIKGLRLLFNILPKIIWHIRGKAEAMIATGRSLKFM